MSVSQMTSHSIILELGWYSGTAVCPSSFGEKSMALTLAQTKAVGASSGIALSH